MGEYVDIGGVNTWYDEEGTGEPLVLLHGGLCTNETWAAQMPVFAEGFHVVAPERRGHGHTARRAGAADVCRHGDRHRWLPRPDRRWAGASRRLERRWDRRPPGRDRAPRPRPQAGRDRGELRHGRYRSRGQGHGREHGPGQR